jgi:hypothetical protein
MVNYSGGHNAWSLADEGLVACNMEDPAAAASTLIAVAGTLYLLRINAYNQITVSNILVGVSTAGNNGGGSTGTFAGLYSSAGTLLSGSADVATLLTSSNTRVLPLTTPQVLAAGSFAWAALLCNLGTTQPTLTRSAGSVAALNFNLAAASYRFCVNGTGLTSLPASITPSSNSQTGALGFLAGAT